jgi:hypothetical protein
MPGLCAAFLALPAVAAAGPDGGTSAPSAGPNTAAPTAVAGALAVTPSTVLEHQVAVVTGSVPASAAGHPLWLQARQGQGAWVTVLAGAANANGAFALSWHASRSGQLSLRVVSSTTASASSVTSTPEVSLAVYRQVVATWYGPGFYGNRTACGERLTKSIVGLADRTLPCGTPVSITYNGVTLTIPVIDRGPYANEATIDLTHAAAQELGITQTVTVDMLALSGPPLAPTNWFAPSTPGTGTTGATGAGGTSFAGGATAPSA